MALVLGLAATGLGSLGAADGARAQEVVRVAAVSRAELDEAVENATRHIQANRIRRIWCVPFARAVSGIEIHGDARTWWTRAGEDYPKGRVPVAGSVLTFRSTSRIPLGHVAVVSEVIGPREILVDQANWVTNRITTDTRVVDVSRQNDWSAVRVENRGQSLGSVYPTYGFIYRPAEDARG